jgi:hypothetical protein
MKKSLLAALILAPALGHAACKGTDIAGTWSLYLTDSNYNTANACIATVGKNGYFQTLQCQDVVSKNTLSASLLALNVGADCSLKGAINWPSGAINTVTATITRDKNQILGVHTSNHGALGTFLAIRP